MAWSGRKVVAAISLAGAFALGGCYDDGYYGGVSVGTGYYGGGYYDDYWGPGYYQPGYYGGWYDGWYYPGSGYYVYDRDGRRQRWNEGQRRYWEGRRGNGERDWRGSSEHRGDWRGSRTPSQGDRRDRRDWRDGNDNAAPTSPPTQQSQPNVTSPRQDWRTRSDGGRWRGGDGRRRGDDGSRDDGQRSWRR